MNSRVSLLAIIVASCLGHVVCRGVETEKRTFSADLEVYDPWGDCVAQLAESDNLTDCDDNLFVTKNADLVYLNKRAPIMKIEIGSNKQVFYVLIDTGSSTTWVFDESCKDTDPICKNHNKYKSGSSTSFKEIDKTFKKKYGAAESTGITAEDTIYLAEGFPAKKQLFGAVTKHTEVVEFDGIIALGFKKTKGYRSIFLNAAEEAGMDPIFSLYLNEGGKGEITFGGLNKDKYNGKTKVTTKIVNSRKYQIQMDEAKFGDTELCKKGGKVNCLAVVDSGFSLIIGPAAVIDPFSKNVLKAVDRVVKCGDVSSFPSFEIKLGGKTLVLEPKHYVLKYGDKCFSVFLGQGDRWVLGNPLMAKYYTTFDLKDATITFHLAV